MAYTTSQLSETNHGAISNVEKLVSLEDTLDAVILDELRRREIGKTICPSEVARIVAPNTWRQLLEPTRQAVHRLVAAGKIVVTQHGRTVDASRAKGAIRLRLR